MVEIRIMADPGSSACRTILVVEDEVMVRAMISEELRTQGCTVMEAANVDEAISVLRSHLRVDLVFTDMRMPGALDGVALVRLIRAEFPFVKVVMISSESPEPDVHALLHGYIRKPFKLAQLGSCLQALAASAVVGDAS